MTKVLLDTDILSEILKGKSAVVTARAGKYLAQQGCFTTSAITVAEIVYGFRRVGREDRVTQFEASLDTAEVLALDDAAARLAGRINADLERARACHRHAGRFDRRNRAAEWLANRDRQRGSL